VRVRNARRGNLVDSARAPWRHPATSPHSRTLLRSRTLPAADRAADVWIDLHGVAAHLRASLAFVGAQRHLVWGRLESYHWNVTRHGPQGYGFGVPDGPCTRSTVAAPDLVGPWPFPKGPLFAVARPLVEAACRSPAVRDEVAGAVAAWQDVDDAAAEALRMQRIKIPFEDTFVGFALSVVVPADGRPMVWVDIGTRVLSQEWYDRVGLTAATLIWHARLKDSGRVRAAHRWAQTHRCSPRLGLQLVPSRAAPCVGSAGAAAPLLLARAARAAYASCNTTPAAAHEL